MERHPVNPVPIRLERSMLFVPASRWPMIEKAAGSAADAVCLDLEDSVVTDEKAAARTNAVRAFNELDFGPRVRMLRINALNTPFAYRDLIEVIEAAGERLDLVMLPKAGSREDIAFVDTMLNQIEMHRGFNRRIGIGAQIETAAGFLAVREIAESSERLEALIFGPGDYAASMQMPSSGIGDFDAHDEAYPGHRWHAVMHAIVASARAHGLRCLDGPYSAYKDVEGFKRSCRIAHAMGFDGKQCIHPSQITIANSIFSPTAEETAWAQKVIDACERATAAGIGAASLDGKMIDAASLRIAQVVTARHRLAQRTLEKKS
ncbi:MAG: CoA ester lyase [Acidobacteriia bacterium]|nr:CoA ester lyase [Terriglobia bacterium]